MSEVSRVSWADSLHPVGARGDFNVRSLSNYFVPLTPALRATLSQRERDYPASEFPLPLGEGGAERRVRVAGLR